MIDIHAHLCLGDYDADIDQIISKCREELSAVIIGTARYDEGIKALALAKKYPNFLFSTLGYHPVDGGTEFEKTIRAIKSNAGEIVGVGEVGLDFHWEKNAEKHKAQMGIFSRFIETAEKLRKPLVVHSWDAERQCFEMVKDSNVDVVFHCFSGPRELAKEIVKRGFYISISTMVLFSKNIRKIAKDTELSNLLLETDSPFLSPNKEHDQRNYPWNIKLSAFKIAELKRLSADVILQKTKENAERVFSLKII